MAKGIRNVWETNFVHDLTSFKLYELEARGKGSTNVSFILADGTMHAHCSQIPAGRYKKAHRHAAGTHVHAVDGEGYSLLWYEGDSEFKEFPWKHGFMYTPPFWMFHQHFNTCDKPARYLACSLGSRRYPFIALRRKSSEGGGSVSVQQGGRQIEYEDQDPRIHRKWLEAMRENGVESQMGDIFDEPAILALAAGSADRRHPDAALDRPGDLSASDEQRCTTSSWSTNTTTSPRRSGKRSPAPSGSRTRSSCAPSASTSAARPRTCCSRASRSSARRKGCRAASS